MKKKKGGANLGTKKRERAKYKPSGSPLFFLIDAASSERRAAASWSKPLAFIFCLQLDTGPRLLNRKDSCSAISARDAGLPWAITPETSGSSNSRCAMVIVLMLGALIVVVVVGVTFFVLSWKFVVVIE